MKKFWIGFAVCFIFGFLGIRLIPLHTPVLKDIRILSQNPTDYATDVPVSDVLNTFYDSLFILWDDAEKPSPDYDFAYKIFPYVDAAGKRYKQAFKDNLRDNSSALDYPNFVYPGIVTQNTELRLIPSEVPLYTSLSSPTFGPPFDEGRAIFLHRGTPIMIHHLSADKIFAVVSTPLGGPFWARFKDVAVVTEAFANDYREQSFKTPIVDGVSFTPEDKVFIGSLLPFKGREIALASRAADGTAFLSWYPLQDALFSDFPVPMSSKTLMSFAAQMQGPYVWGGLRDCSSFLRDLFAPFGLYLYGNSYTQANSFQSLDVSSFSADKKKELLVKHGEPFLTLVYLPGHIMLYLGHKNGEPILMHMIWGVRTYDVFLRQQRAVLGRLVISTLNLGEDLFSVRLFDNAISGRVTKIVFLTRPAADEGDACGR